MRSLKKSYILVKKLSVAKGKKSSIHVNFFLFIVEHLYLGHSDSSNEQTLKLKLAAKNFNRHLKEIGEERRQQNHMMMENSEYFELRKC